MSVRARRRGRRSPRYGWESLPKSTLVEDGVSEALVRAGNKQLAAEISHLTVAELKQILLSDDGVRWARHYRGGLASEVIAAVVKVANQR